MNTRPENTAKELAKNAREARDDLASLQGFISILRQQVLVLHDNCGDNWLDDKELREELCAIARSLTIARTMLATSEDDVYTLGEHICESFRPAPYR